MWAVSPVISIFNVAFYLLYTRFQESSFEPAKPPVQCSWTPWIPPSANALFPPANFSEHTPFLTSLWTSLDFVFNSGLNYGNCSWVPITALSVGQAYNPRAISDTRIRGHSQVLAPSALRSSCDWGFCWEPQRLRRACLLIHLCRCYSLAHVPQLPLALSAAVSLLPACSGSFFVIIPVVTFLFPQFGNSIVYCLVLCWLALI